MPQGAPKMVLVVDDDPDFLDFVTIVLESGGYIVRTATHADAGLERMQAECPDLVIVDVMMSYELDGWAVSRQMSGDPQLRQVPVLMVSAIVDASDASALPRNGRVRVDAFMSKPLDPSTLLRRVAELTGAES